jgi:hypothetical protein
MGIELRYKDIDPDTGSITRDELICFCLDVDAAKWIKLSIESDWYGENGPCDPNREFYMVIGSMSKEEELSEDILDIIDSENSGLSHEQRIYEIRKMLIENGNRI